MADTCGAPALGGPCTLPVGHNMGRLDVPSNHWHESESGTVQKLVRDAFSQVHNQDPMRRYSVAEVKQIVYPLIEALRGLPPLAYELRDEIAETIRTQGSRGQYQMPHDERPYQTWAYGIADALLAKYSIPEPTPSDQIEAPKTISEPNYPGHPDDWTDEQWAHYQAWKKQEENR